MRQTARPCCCIPSPPLLQPTLSWTQRWTGWTLRRPCALAASAASLGSACDNSIQGWAPLCRSHSMQSSPITCSTTLDALNLDALVQPAIDALVLH